MSIKYATNIKVNVKLNAIKSHYDPSNIRPSINVINYKDFSFDSIL